MERFKMPTDEQIIGFALLFNDGDLSKENIANSVGMCNMILDRLYEHGDILKKSSKEIILEE